MSIVKQGQENLDRLLCFDKSDNRDSQENRDSQAQEMATNYEDDPYNNAVLKKNDNTEEKGEKEKLFSFRGKIPRFKFHDESKLPPPLPPSRLSASRFQTSSRPVTHSFPRVTRTLPRR